MGSLREPLSPGPHRAPRPANAVAGSGNSSTGCSAPALCVGARATVHWDSTPHPPSPDPCLLVARLRAACDGAVAARHQTGCVFFSWAASATGVSAAAAPPRGKWDTPRAAHVARVGLRQRCARSLWPGAAAASARAQARRGGVFGAGQGGNAPPTCCAVGARRENAAERFLRAPRGNPPLPSLRSTHAPRGGRDRAPAEECEARGPPW